MGSTAKSRAATDSKPLSPHARAKRPLREKKRAAILDSAELLFLAKGYAGTSLDAVSLNSGISKTTIYKHFGSKDTLFREVVERKVSQNNSQIEAPNPADPPEKQLLHLAQSTTNVLLDPDFLALHRMMIASSGEFAEMIQWQYQVGMASLLTSIKHVITGLEASGALELDNIDLATQDFLALTQGMGGRAIQASAPGDIISSVPQEFLARGVRNFLKIYSAA